MPDILPVLKIIKFKELILSQYQLLLTYITDIVTHIGFVYKDITSHLLILKIILWHTTKPKLQLD